MENVEVKEFSHFKYFYDLLRSLIISFFIGIRLFYKRVTMKRKDIKGSLALVTGGGKGLGREICLALAKEGCNIAIVDIDKKSSNETVQDCRSLGVKANYFECDVSDAENFKKLKPIVKEKAGIVDILINNAGILFNRPILEESPENIKKMIDINLMSVFWVCR
uniref:CSON013070 protein n=1 Tax=Culicoides sonorensis TaxID=179676 RepID=A0A336LH69_CULSO